MSYKGINRPSCACPRSTSSTTKRANPSAFKNSSAAGPSLPFGNSDGDYEMLGWTTVGDGLRLGLIVHHTDADREYAYDRDSHFGRLDKALAEAGQRGWVVVDMKRDWKRVFASEK